MFSLEATINYFHLYLNTVSKFWRHIYPWAEKKPTGAPRPFQDGNMNQWAGERDPAQHNMGKRTSILVWRMDGRIPRLWRAAEVRRKAGGLSPSANLKKKKKKKNQEPQYSYLKTGHNGISPDYTTGFCEIWNKPTTFLPLTSAALSARDPWPPYFLVKILLALQMPPPMPTWVSTPHSDVPSFNHMAPCLYDSYSNWYCSNLYVCLGISFQKLRKVRDYLAHLVPTPAPRMAQ